MRAPFATAICLLAACGGNKAEVKATGDAGAGTVAEGSGAKPSDPLPCPKAAGADPTLPGDAAAEVLPGLTRTTWLEAARKSASVDEMLAALALPAAGTFTMDLTPVKENDERLVLVDAAARAGLVLLDAGDRRMVWLGRDAQGVGRVLRAVDAACGGGAMASAELDPATLTGITTYAHDPGPELGGAVALRKAEPVVPPTGKACDDSQDAAIFFSPNKPSSAGPMRVIATLDHDPGPVELVLIDPDGERHAPEMVRLGGPPWSYVITVDAPAAGTWTAVIGDGARVEACLAAKVGKKRSPRKGGTAGAVWAGKRHWNAAVENLYAAFVQRLFDYPVDQDLTWPNLHTLLRDKDHNLLYDHLGHGEDDELELEPDCADMPYTLEAYFAWKMDLPYAFVVCNRGGGKHPPRCKDDDPERPPGDNLMPRSELKHSDEVGAFSDFARKVMSGVSSSSGRTGPDDDLTDWYPVALTREALRPGTLFADPYGHLMVLVAWYPQQPGGYGILMGADAQPDATVGRRRFWRGNYLFTSETTFAGAGFKAFRPRIRQDGDVIPWDNKKLSHKGWWAPWSTQQYDGTTDDFYDTMEELINPRPLDAMSMQVSLVDALEEAVVRRINSVDNGEQFKKTDSSEIPMPDGAKIFLTSGPWEDFSTPSRDHRILIAIDTVLGLAAAVERRPERYRLAAADVPDMLVKLKDNQDKLLAARTFQYVRSDGTPQTLTLADVVARAPGFEIAYNPNDCVEVRWGAPEDSPEMATCQRRAPADQRAKMEKYRAWYHKRERPIE
jgi:hypothetical protein